MSGRRSMRGGFGLLMLASQIMHIGPGRIPPVTLITVVVNVVIYMKLIPKLPSVHGACTSNYLVVNQKQWLRLCTSSFYHLDDMHLYYNMVSFIWKGLTLERKMKSKKFFIVIALFSVMTQVVMLIVNKIFSEIFSSEQYLMTCAAGFSAVLFALKVLTTYNSDANVGLMGLPISIPSRYACWVELILIHIMVPNSSFTGHLSGILVGLLYTHGPLRKVVKGLKYLISTATGLRTARRNAATYTYQAETTGTAGYRDSDESVEVQRAIQESMRNSNFAQESMRNSNFTPGGSHTRSQPPPPSYGWNISDEPVNEQNTLYPNIPRNENQSPGGGNINRPSAPPYPTSSTSKQYPSHGNNNIGSSPYPTTTSNPPYPSTNNDLGTTEEIQSNESPEEVMRKARLRKFDKN